MTSRRQFLVSTASIAAFAAIAGFYGVRRAESAAADGTFEVTKTEEEWRAILTPDQYAVLRTEATEPPGSSPLLEEHREGTFHCAGCDLAVFSSATKFESGTGWPSFWQEIEGAVGFKEDTALFMTRIEEHCARCGGHLGHVFDDGPAPTGKRHCINGLALTFKPGVAATTG